MERAEFIRILLCAGCLGGCTKPASYPSNGNVDFTLDLNLGDAVRLQSVGGHVFQSGVIVARTDVNEFSAIASPCSHLGTRLEYDPATTNFFCPREFARWDKTGLLLQGPAVFSQRKYKTDFDGDKLRVHSF